MCQINSKPVKKKTVRAVRIYRGGLAGDPIVSYFNGIRKPKNGIWVKKTKSKIHACQTRDDARAMMECCTNYPEEQTYYSVQLAGKIKAGVWGDHESIRTYTADRMKIIRRIK